MIKIIIQQLESGFDKKWKPHDENLCSDVWSRDDDWDALEEEEAVHLSERKP